MRFARLAAIAVAAFLSIAADKPRPGGPHPNWLDTVAVTESGSHVLGNPDADVKLVEFVSYTCPHCAHFEEQSNAPLRISYVMPGKVSVEVRHLLRDAVDLTVAMLTNCGKPEKFFDNHKTFLYRQDNWIKAMDSASDAQKQRWANGELPQRMRAIAADFGFYAIMEQRGYDRPAVNRCLADEAKARTLTTQTQGAVEAGVQGTPSFMLNGVLLTGTHDWKSLDDQLRARM